MQPFNYVPANGFRDASSYPDPASEAQAREQLMSLHDQMRTYVNQVSSEVTSLETDVAAIAGAMGDPAAIAQIQNDLNGVKIWYFDEEVAGATADTSVYEDGYTKTYTCTVVYDSTKAQIEFPDDDYSGNVTWQTNNDHTINLYFDQDPNGLNIRVSLLATFQTTAV